jgi:hypothetical protein
MFRHPKGASRPIVVRLSRHSPKVREMAARRDEELFDLRVVAEAVRRRGVRCVVATAPKLVRELEGGMRGETLTFPDRTRT